MTSAQRKRILGLLLALERELSVKGSVRIEPNRTDGNKVGGDEDEQPLNEMLQAIASNRNRSSAEVMAKVKKALRKLRESPDEFGECEECGEEIAFARLQVTPYTEFCVDCQGKRDAPKGSPTRRKLTDFR